MIEFQTNELKNRKQVSIDGHHYTVRRYGNIEQLNLAQYHMRLRKLQEKEAKGALTDKEDKEVQDIINKVTEMNIALFDDHGDQSKSKKLVSSLSEEELTEIFSKVFDEPEKTAEA